MRNEYKRKDSKLKIFLKKFWYLVWKDDSIKGWIISLLFIFILVKFIFFPLLFLITGTKLPLVVVESCSMYHEGNLLSDFEGWWTTNGQKYEQFGINKEAFYNYSLHNGFNKGDIIFSTKEEIERLKQGDVIIFDAQQSHPIIHRIVEIQETNNEKIFSTMGDHNPSQLSIEKRISGEQVISKAHFKIPYLGWVKLFPANIITKQPIKRC